MKDPSKYMPEKVLELAEKWIRDAKIEVHEELASEKDLNGKEKRLVWTLKHALRWIKRKDPKFHRKLEKILGKNYVLYFDEKRNRLAQPR